MSKVLLLTYYSKLIFKILFCRYATKEINSDQETYQIFKMFQEN